MIDPNSSRSERVEGSVERDTRVFDLVERSCSLSNINENKQIRN